MLKTYILLISFQFCFITHFEATKINLPFRNVHLPWSDRVEDLVKRLTVEEIVEQLMHGGAGLLGGPAPPISRLGIGPYQWDTECLSGVGMAGFATSFPQVIGLAATFDKDLVFDIARATALEARAKNNKAKHENNYSDHTSLSCFAPNINIMIHPLWGRNQETYGEDPFLTAKMASSFVRGLQGEDRYILSNAGCKHFAAHNGPENIPVSRLSFNALVSDQDLWQTFLPAFKQCVHAGAMSIMCSYNRMNNVVNCANDFLLNHVLRDTFNFTGYVVSDQGALEFAVDFHKAFKNLEDVAVAAIKAGVNLELVSSEVTNVSQIAFGYLKLALNQSKITQHLLRKRVKPLFYTRMRLGEFDPDWMVPLKNIDMTVVQSTTHRQLSLNAAAKSFVLLWNQNQLLPLKTTSFPRMALIGPFANNMSLLYGGYAADRDSKYEISIINGLQQMGSSVQWTMGCDDGVRCTSINESNLMQTIKHSDLIVLALGTGPDFENENIDRQQFALPGLQSNLLVTTRRLSSVPIILLLFTGSPVAIAPLLFNVNAALWCGFPGQTTGNAISLVLSGAMPPAGRLPFTWYKDADQLPNRTDYKMGGKSYRYFSGLPQFPFGFGLTYTNFKYSNIQLSHHLLNMNDDLYIRFQLSNIGAVEANEVAQVYWWPLERLDGNPRLQLIAFKRIQLAVGQTKMVRLQIEAESLKFWNGKEMMQIPGKYIVSVGGGQPSFVQTYTFKITIVQ